MPTLYVMVALPRSGKTSYVSEHFKGIPVVSADQLRLLIHGKRYAAEQEPKVWWVRDIMLKALMEQGLDVVVDQTNITRKRREPLVKLAEEYGFKAVAVVLKTDVETCKARAVETDQEDLLPVIEEFAEQFEPVTEDEGFEEIIYV
ncbi:MAG: AAA family ATPase [Bacillota bacterium]|jgi:predicted kinase